MSEPFWRTVRKHGLPKTDGENHGYNLLDAVLVWREGRDDIDELTGLMRYEDDGNHQWAYECGSVMVKGTDRWIPVKELMALPTAVPGIPDNLKSVLKDAKDLQRSVVRGSHERIRIDMLVDRIKDLVDLSQQIIHGNASKKSGNACKSQ